VPADARRLRRPIGRRDRRFFGVLAAGAAVAAAVGALGLGARTAPSESPRCITRPAVGVMGGGAWRFCGARAVAFCRTHANADRALAARCEKLDVRVGD
jgi:hypothetical protein